MSLLNMLMGSMTSPNTIDSLSQQSGASMNQVGSLITAALPILLGAMTKNASTQSGANSLLGALSGHKNRNTIQDQIFNADREDGSKIIGHILGNKSGDVMSALSRQTGMSQKQVNSVLGGMAPALLSGLSAATSQARRTGNMGFDFGGAGMGDIAGMFGGSRQNVNMSGLSGVLGALMGPTANMGGMPGMGGGMPGMGGGMPAMMGAGNFGDLFGDLFGDDMTEQSSFDGTSLLGSLLSFLK